MRAQQLLAMIESLYERRTLYYLLPVAGAQSVACKFWGTVSVYAKSASQHPFDCRCMVTLEVNDLELQTLSYTWRLLAQHTYCPPAR